jgi:hypothetical protein
MEGVVMWVICDSELNIVHIEGLKIFGVGTRILACFVNEVDALNVLFEMENSGALKNHTVRYVDRLTGSL